MARLPSVAHYNDFVHNITPHKIAQSSGEKIKISLIWQLLIRSIGNSAAA